MQKILIITDAWAPQVNGVVRTYQNIISILQKQGVEIKVIHPYLPQFNRLKFSAYPEIELVKNPWKMKALLRQCELENYNIHIATEGPLGIYARLLLRKKKFTTCYHTQFPEFIEARTKLPAFLFYPFFRWFHNSSKCCMVPTKTMFNFLKQKGFKSLGIWSRGVNSEIFNPSRKTDKGEPYILCVSRVSHEKGLDDFCKLSFPRKVLIGDGPYLSALKNTYRDVEFIGKKEGVELAEWYASAEVFVFPSKKDTFGIVILEALASGTPVASYWQPGPMECIRLTHNGMMSDNLQYAVDTCAKSVFRDDVYESSKSWTWKASAENFIDLVKKSVL